MGTLKEKLSYLSETKEAIKQALIKQQVTVTDEDTFRSYADKISGIEGGGGSKVISTMPASNAGSINTNNMIEICSSDGANYSSEIEIQNIMANRFFASEEEAQGYAFANSIYSSDRQPWKAFDGNTSTLWSTESTDNQDGKYWAVRLVDAEAYRADF